MACIAASAVAQSSSSAAPASRHDFAIIEVRYREAADVFEMLDQVSEWWPDYVEPAYRKSWSDAGRILPEDSTYFAQYAQLRERHIDRATQTGSGRRGASGLFTAGATATADRVAAAFYQSDSLNEAYERLRPILTASEVDFLRRFYAHFQSRTSPLTAATRASTSASRTVTAQLLADTAVVHYLTKVAAFFSVVPTDSTHQAANTSNPALAPLSVLYVTWPDSQRTFATPSGRVLILRVRPWSGDAVNSADVVVHEAVHVFAAGIPEAQKSAMSGTLLDGCAVSEAVRRLAVLEEPIATAIGNIEFRRRFMPERFAWGRRWYGDAWADVYARLLHPLLADRLEAGRQIDGAFAREATGLCAALLGLTRGAV